MPARMNFPMFPFPYIYVVGIFTHSPGAESWAQAFSLISAPLVPGRRSATVKSYFMRHRNYGSEAQNNLKVSGIHL